jgi:hypothetical protein
MGYLKTYPMGVIIDMQPCTCNILNTIKVRTFTRGFHLLDGSFFRMFLGDI